VAGLSAERSRSKLFKAARGAGGLFLPGAAPGSAAGAAHAPRYPANADSGAEIAADLTANAYFFAPMATVEHDDACSQQVHVIIHDGGSAGAD
jgi:hypothetical protein